MRILRVIPSMDPAKGGPCQGIRNLIPKLKELGIYNEVVCMDSPASSYNDEFPVHAIGEASGAWAYNGKLSAWLGENLQRFDVVIIHGLWLYHSFATMKVLRGYNRQNGAARPKVYVMPHGMLDPWFQKAKGRKLKAIRNWVYWKLIERNVVNRADGLLFTCEEELRLAREAFYPYSPKRELNVGYGISSPPEFLTNMNEAFKAHCPLPDNARYLLFLSRIHEKKGVDLLVKAYLNLKKENHNLPYLVVAGPGVDTIYGKEIAKLASVDSHIVFPGMLTNDVKWGAFYGCEAFILPSHQENFGISIVEALACGKPVLISNKINIWREIEDGMCGIVEDDTLAGVEDLLRKWMGLSTAEKRDMSGNSVSVYQRYFANGPAAERLMQALES